jgi:hypothetical protein
VRSLTAPAVEWSGHLYQLPLLVERSGIGLLHDLSAVDGGSAIDALLARETGVAAPGRCHDQKLSQLAETVRTARARESVRRPALRRPAVPSIE